MRLKAIISKVIQSVFIGIGIFLIFPSLSLAEVAIENECCPSVEVGLTGGWFSIFAPNTDYVLNRNDNYANSFPSGDYVGINPKHRFGGEIFLNFQTGCCYDWSLHYFRFHERTRDSITGTALGPNLIPPLVLFEDGVSVFAEASSALLFDYHFANLEVGSNVCVIADCLTIHPKLGISYARIKYRQKTTYGPGGTVNGQFQGSGIGPIFVGGVFDPVYTEIVNMGSTFHGVGPSLGVDLDYSFCRLLSFFGEFRFSALAGSLNGKYFTTVTNFSPRTFVTGATGDNIFRSKRHFVKLFQSELGLNYPFNWSSYCGNFQVGYMFTQAFDVTDRITFTDDAAMSELVHQNENAGFHGPFLRVTAKFGF